jgi:hypothetical protein
VTSRDIPLRLLSSPITATRSAIGVVPGAIASTVCGTSTVTGSGSPLPDRADGVGERSQAPSASRPAATVMAVKWLESGLLTGAPSAQFGVQAS